MQTQNLGIVGLAAKKLKVPELWAWAMEVKLRQIPDLRLPLFQSKPKFPSPRFSCFFFFLFSFSINFEFSHCFISFYLTLFVFVSWVIHLYAYKSLFLKSWANGGRVLKKQFRGSVEVIISNLVEEQLEWTKFIYIIYIWKESEAWNYKFGFFSGPIK